ncbi:serine hydrolase FSH [Xylariaceae sp. FL0016]|nr:serine hydrolase FSH [Xylariaceae sp. FL0016]
MPDGKREVKILMLHGYTQSGPLFNSKTKALHKLLQKSLSPAPYNLHPTLIFPSGPHNLHPSDIPGYQPPDDGGDDAEDGPTDNWAWFRKEEATGLYRGLEPGMQSLASCIRAHGGIDGVCGFSQGGAMAALVAAALEKPHKAPGSHTPSPTSSSPTSADWSWVEELREANGGKPLDFAIIYSGFWAPVPGLQWLYEPPIETPTLHFIGSLDTVVEEGRSTALIKRCKDPMELTHPGGHYVPVAKQWVMPLAQWLIQRYQHIGGAKESL